MTGNLNNWKNIEYNDDNHDGHYDADDEKAGQGHDIFFYFGPTCCYHSITAIYSTPIEHLYDQ